MGVASAAALRTLLNSQLDGTLLHLAEVEAQAGAAAAGLGIRVPRRRAARRQPGTERGVDPVRPALDQRRQPLVRSRNLPLTSSCHVAPWLRPRAGGSTGPPRSGEGSASAASCIPSYWWAPPIKPSPPGGCPQNRSVNPSPGFRPARPAHHPARWALTRWLAVAGAALRPTGEITPQAETILQDAFRRSPRMPTLRIHQPGPGPELDAGPAGPGVSGPAPVHRGRQPRTAGAADGLKGELDLALKRERSPRSIAKLSEVPGGGAPPGAPGERPLVAGPGRFRCPPGSRGRRGLLRLAWRSGWLAYGDRDRRVHFAFQARK